MSSMSSVCADLNHLFEWLMSESVESSVCDLSQSICNSLRAGNKVIFAGNGGSAADAQHFSAEFVSRFNFDRPALSSLSLTVDTSALTAIANDYGYEYVFSRQLYSLARRGDFFIGISTSGKSKNILNAFDVANEIGCHTVSFTGSSCIPANFSFAVPSLSTPRVQEIHGILGHHICSEVEKIMYG